MSPARILLSAAHKSSGKTTVAIGLCAALANKGFNVQAFKKGPDYIDPLWLSMACGRACYNLDFHTMSAAEISNKVAALSSQVDISIIEGNKGLYDGLSLDGSNSNAALARHLHTPVILVLDARGMTRGIAPLVLGYQAFDRKVQIPAVILNQVGGSRHESKLRAILEHYTDVKVIGAVQHNDELVIDERHLGLVPSNEKQASLEKIATIAGLVASQVNLDQVLAIASTAPALLSKSVENIKPRPLEKIRLGIAQDAAFGFYYPDDLDALRNAGAELVPINTLTDSCLPVIDGLLIGGGFPETHLPELAANLPLRLDIKSKIENGLPTYAECGGLMYLARKITWDDKSGEMVGVIPADIEMHAKPQGRGYVELQETGESLWRVSDAKLQGNINIHAHEFHYSRLVNFTAEHHYAYRVLRGFGIDGKNDGLMMYNMLASYSHLRSVGYCKWASHFVEFIRQHKQQLQSVQK